MERTTYFAIPGHYTIGDEFPALDRAVLGAIDRILRYRETNAAHGTFIPERVFVDERVRDQDGDRPVRRYTIESNEIETTAPPAFALIDGADEWVEHLRSMDEELHGLGDIDGGGF